MISTQDIKTSINHIQDSLFDNQEKQNIIPQHIPNVLNQSAVLLPIGPKCKQVNGPDEPCLILNKRSKKVRQAGDLCCPGGSVSKDLDRFLGKLITFPLSSLRKWKYWSHYRQHRPEDARKLAVFYATSLRESFEEMRLNPFGVRFLGTLPPKQLVLKDRFIFPMVGWIPRQQKFLPNWEVDEIVRIPLKSLLNHDNYAICRLSFAGYEDAPPGLLPPQHPGFFHETDDGLQLLWGATYRIVMDFLNLVFDFTPPDPASVPMVNWELDENYFNGPPRA